MSLISPFVSTSERINAINDYCASDFFKNWCEVSRPAKCEKCGAPGNQLKWIVGNGKYQCGCGHISDFDQAKHMTLIYSDKGPREDKLKAMPDGWKKRLYHWYLNWSNRWSCTCPICGDAFGWKRGRCVEYVKSPYHSKIICYECLEKGLYKFEPGNEYFGEIKKEYIDFHEQNWNKDNNVVHPKGTVGVE